MFDRRADSLAESPFHPVNRRTRPPPRGKTRRHIKYMTSPGNEVHPMMLPQKIDTRNYDFNSKRWSSWARKDGHPTSNVRMKKAPLARNQDRTPFKQPWTREYTHPSSHVRSDKTASFTTHRSRSRPQQSSPKTFLKGEVVDIHGRLDDLSTSIDDWIDFLTTDPCKRKKKRLNPRHHRLASNEIWFGDSSESFYPRHSRAGSETTSLSPSPNRFRQHRWSASPSNQICTSRIPIANRTSPPLRQRRGHERSSCSLRGLLEDEPLKPVFFKSFKRHEGPIMGGKRFIQKPNMNRFDSISLKKRLTRNLSHSPSILEELPEEDYLGSFSPSSSSSSLASSDISVPKVETSTTSDGITLDDTFFEIPGINTDHGYAHEKKWREHFDLHKHQDIPLPDNFTTGSFSVEKFYDDAPEIVSEDLWRDLGRE